MKNPVAAFCSNASETIRGSILLRRLFIVAWHILGLFATYHAAFFLRFDGQVPVKYQLLMWYTLPSLILVCLLVFAWFRLYSGMWSFFSVNDLARMGLALTTAVTVFGLVVLALRPVTHVGFPRSVLAIEFMLMGFWMTGGRFAARYVRERAFGERTGDGQASDRILIVGTPEDADLVLRGTRSRDIGTVVGIVTEDERRRGLTLHGVRILGDVSAIGELARRARADCILALPPFNRPGRLDDMVAQCAEKGVACKFRTLPSLSDLASGHITATSIREVDIEDLLGRESARLDRTEVRRFLKGKRVMVTGAGGSIGREICLQVAGYEPGVLVLFECSEFALYEIDRAVRTRYPNLRVVSSAGDIRHPEEIEQAMDAAGGGVDVIYHAAAYKHVPLMEANVPACFRTNVLGTARLADVAIRRGVDRFVMISSDKAVRPTSVMGATKRLAERVIAERPACGTTFVSVRFGNVLGSSGSVIPLFKAQIAAGGPVTVTDPEVRRFFMTIPEAVDLVLQAGTIGRNGDIMVLEMGDSIRIADLARRLIELSGLVPDKDIRIVFTGMRPGEKTHEEVMTEDENVVRTAYDRIWVMRKHDDRVLPPSVDLALVETRVTAADEQGLRALASDWIPENEFTVSAR